MKAIYGLLLMASSTVAARKHHYQFSSFHGNYAAEHDALVALQGDDKPPPEVPGGLSDSRYISHWRKDWPEGVTDASQNDEDVLHLKGKGRKYKEPKDKITYPWTLDSDIIDSQRHLEDVQGKLEHTMDERVYRDRGYAVLNRGYKAIKSTYL